MRRRVPDARVKPSAKAHDRRVLGHASGRRTRLSLSQERTAQSVTRALLCVRDGNVGVTPTPYSARTARPSRTIASTLRTLGTGRSEWRHSAHRESGGRGRPVRRGAGASDQLCICNWPARYASARSALTAICAFVCRPARRIRLLTGTRADERLATHPAVSPRAAGRLHRPDDPQAEPREADRSSHCCFDPA